MIEVVCPGCGGRGKLRANAAGRPVTCPRCRTVFTVEAPLGLREPAVEQLECPLCTGKVLIRRNPGWGCERCQGDLLRDQAVEELLRGVLQIDPAILGRLSSFRRGAAVPCPACAEAMSPITLRDVAVDHCRACGALWLDGGELHRITAGGWGRPFDPHRLSAIDEQPAAVRRLLEALVQAQPVLRIRQEKEWPEILVGWETANRYGIWGGRRQVGYVLERGADLGTALLRQLLGSHRPLDVLVTAGTGGRALLSFSRPFFWFFSTLKVFSESPARLLGKVERRFGIVVRHYDLHDETGHLFARIRSPWWHPWSFPVRDLGGERRALIAKRWGGLLREGLTDADTFAIDFGNHPWSLSQRCVLLAAALSIDFDFFERSTNL